MRPPPLRLSWPDPRRLAAACTLPASLSLADHRRSLATRPVWFKTHSVASRDVLARYAPGASPIKSRSDVPLRSLLGEAGGDPSSPAPSPAKGPMPSLLQPSPQRPIDMLKDVLTPTAPPAGAGPLTVAGVEVPTKPVQPGEEDCCMSGCAICIYDIYAESLLEYNTALRAARKALLAAGTSEADWPLPVHEMHRKLAAREERSHRRNAAVRDATIGSSAEQAAAAVVAQDAAEEIDCTLEDIDPATRAFLEFESKLKKSKQAADAG